MLLDIGADPTLRNGKDMYVLLKALSFEENRLGTNLYAFAYSHLCRLCSDCLPNNKELTNDLQNTFDAMMNHYHWLQSARQVNGASVHKLIVKLLGLGDVEYLNSAHKKCL